MLQDGFDRAVAGRADIIAALAGGLDAHRAVAAREPQNAETSAEALLGVWLRLHDCLDQSYRGGADLGGLSLNPRWRPFGIATVRARHVLGDRGVATPRVGARVAGPHGCPCAGSRRSCR